MSRADGHDHRLVPVAAAAWAGSWVGTAEWWPGTPVLIPAAAAPLLIAVVASRSHHPWVAMCLIVAVVTGVTAGAQSWQRHASPLAQVAAEGAAGLVEVRLSSEPLLRGDVVVARGTVTAAEVRGRRVAGSFPVVLLGSGRAGEELAGLANGAGYRLQVRFSATAAGEPEVALLSVRSVVEGVHPPGPAQRIANDLRAGLRTAVSHSPPDQAALVPSLVVGDTSGIDETMRDEFQATGLTHLSAVSGANLMLLLAVLLPLVRTLGLRGWWVRGSAVAGVAGFVVVCGQEPSVLRAAAMGIIALAATGAGRGRRSLRSLSVAVLVLCWLDPWLSRSAGFCLSVAACAGILLVAPTFRAAVARWGPGWLADALAVSLAAQLATQPIVTGLSGQVSLVGVAANVLAAPFVGPTTVLGLAAALTSAVAAPAAALLGWLAGWTAQPIVWIARFGARLPGATWRWETTTVGLLGVTLLVLGVGVLLARWLRHPVGGLLLVAVVVLAALAPPVTPGWPGSWQAVFCDVGQGDATALRAASDAAVLVDTGPDAAGVSACLADLGIRRVPLLVLTHYHADHTGGTAAVLGRLRPEVVLVRDGPAPDWLLAAARDVGARVRSAVPGERIRVGDVAWTTVAVGRAPRFPGGPVDGEGSAENDASVVGLAEVAGLRVLLPGDLEPPGQAAALRSAARLGIGLGVHVLKLPHHGSARQEPRLFAAVGAALAVASAGEDNDYGHPAEAVQRLARQSGMAMARTDQQGSIAVTLSGDALSVRPQR